LSDEFLKNPNIIRRFLLPQYKNFLSFIKILFNLNTVYHDNQDSALHLR